MFGFQRLILWGAEEDPSKGSRKMDHSDRASELWRVFLFLSVFAVLFVALLNWIMASSS
jgi:hypothetical protein